jgi:ribose transport system ATP-binding protein
VGTGRIRDVGVKDLVREMVGRSLGEMYPRIDHRMGRLALEVRDLQGSPLPSCVSLSLRQGEILGIAGLVGAGRSETVRCLFGLHRARNGAMAVGEGGLRPLGRLTPGRALCLGFDLLSENRKDEGLATGMSVAANVTLSCLGRYGRRGLLRLAAERGAAHRWCERLAVKCRDVEAPVSSLSGGNQQKVALARLLHHDSNVLFLDEPTRGIDVGSKAEIYRLIQRLAAEGKAIVMVSSYLPELLGICDTIAVMHRGRLSPARRASEWTEQEIMLYAAAGTLDGSAS